MPATTEQKTAVLSAHRFDFDGCVFHHDYAYSQDAERLFTCNKVLLTEVEAIVASEQPMLVDVGVGSARQSYSIDIANYHDETHEDGRRKWIGSCFPAIGQLRDNIAGLTGVETTLSKFLMADIYAEREPGYAFDKALAAVNDVLASHGEKQHDPQGHPDAIFDHSKISTLYAQMHLLAIQHPDKIIQLHFYDDRENILQWLAKFYRQHPQLMPKNVALHLHVYFADDFVMENSPPIQGTGVTDLDYRGSVMEMMRLCHRDPEQPNGVECNVFNDLDVAKFKTYRRIPPEPAKSLASSLFSFWKADRFYQQELAVAGLALATSVAAVKYFHPQQASLNKPK